MNTEKQRIAIAEACGWKRIKRLQSGWHGWIEQGPIEELPDYLNDLNAMHEAEEMLTDKQIANYFCALMDNNNPRPNAALMWKCIHATAAQRAEAFLKTIGKWEDGQ